jgi:hypothetical protein
MFIKANYILTAEERHEGRRVDKAAEKPVIGGSDARIIVGNDEAGLNLPAR